MTLRERIEQEISQHGPISFSRYMELCLYDDMGYYARHSEQFGKAGDFYTSSDVHAVFGRLLARQFDEMWRILGSPEPIEILEFGPGRGLFARDVLDWCEKKFPSFFRAVHYGLCETSPALQERLKHTLARHFDSGKCTLEPLAAGRALTTDVPLIAFANEFFDALPVEVLSSRGKLQIDVHNGRFVETWTQPSPEETEFLDRYSIHPEPGERIEAPLVAQTQMKNIVARVPRGFIIVIDYGYTRDELLAGRHRGTVMAYRQHSASPNPYEAPGEQDITAHVNFTALAAAAHEEAMQTQKLLTQSQFLMGIGEPTQFADSFEDCKLPQERAKVALQLKHLVTPAGMGESFHVLVASRGVEAERVSQLAGLRFGKNRT